MSTQSYSSIGAGKRRGTAHDDIDRSFYTVGQTLASIVNDPRAPSQSGGFWGLANEGAAQIPQLPPLDPARYPPVSKADLQRYIELVHGAYERFVKDRQSLEAFDSQFQGRDSAGRRSSSGSSHGQQGEPFMVAVQAVPTQFFQEGFFDNWDDFFKQYCQEQSAEELYEQIDVLNRNLDVVEMQLLREVASRSSSFFQAASTLQLLQGELSEAVRCIRGLRQELADADQDLYSTAAAVKALQARSDNLHDTLDITKGLDEVVSTQQALECMLENQDYAGALDLLDQLKVLLQQPQLMGLQCLRHLPPKLLDVVAAVDAALSNEFLSTVTNPHVAQLAAQAASDAEAHPDAGISPDGSRQSGSDTWCLTDPRSTDSSTAADEQLQEKLLPLAVGLYRSESLAPTLQQYKTNAGEEVKAAVRDMVQQVLPVLLAACGSSLTPQQEAAGVGEVHAWEQLQLLHHGAFMVLLYAVARAIFSCLHHTVRVGQLLHNILNSINAPPSQSSSVLKACGVAVQVASDVGMGRWVKLLNARSSAHTQIKQYELKQILDLSEQVAEYVESVGARPLSSFRMALQGQCKALLDSNHTRCMTQLQGLLEVEQWVAVDVPAGFQAIVNRLLVRCAEGAALLDGREVPSTPTHKRGSSSGGGSRVGRASAAGDSSSASPAAPAAASAEEQQPVLHLCGKSFHLVNSALMLIKMVDEYMSLHDLMPQFGAEIVHRQLELMKLFNSQTAALVLGAGAMRTAGLRSISAKQLALSCQAIAMLSTLLQPLRAGCLAMVSQPRRALLMPEYDRLLQDLTMHIDEVHSKLVDIMRDRLAAAMQALPAEVRAAAPVGGSASCSAPTPTIALLTKQLATLRAVLVPLLLREEVEFVFGAVSRSYSDALSDTFEALLSEPNSGWEQVVQINALTMLEAFRELPLDPARSNNYSARLTTTYTKHFGLPPWDQQRLGHKLQQQQAAKSAAASQMADPPGEQQQDQQQQQQEQQSQQQGQQQHPDELAEQHVLQQQGPATLTVAAVGAAATAAAAGVAAAGVATAPAANEPPDAAAIKPDSHNGAVEPLVTANGLHTTAAAAAAAVPELSLQTDSLPEQLPEPPVINKQQEHEGDQQPQQQQEEAQQQPQQQQDEPGQQQQQSSAALPGDNQELLGEQLEQQHQQQPQQHQPEQEQPSAAVNLPQSLPVDQETQQQQQQQPAPAAAAAPGHPQEPQQHDGQQLLWQQELPPPQQQQQQQGQEESAAPTGPDLQQHQPLQQVLDLTHVTPATDHADSAASTAAVDDAAVGDAAAAIHGTTSSSAEADEPPPPLQQQQQHEMLQQQPPAEEQQELQHVTLQQQQQPAEEQQQQEQLQLHLLGPDVGVFLQHESSSGQAVNHELPQVERLAAHSSGAAERQQQQLGGGDPPPPPTDHDVLNELFAPAAAAAAEALPTSGQPAPELDLLGSPVAPQHQSAVSHTPEAASSTPEAAPDTAALTAGVVMAPGGQVQAGAAAGVSTAAAVVAAQHQVSPLDLLDAELQDSSGPDAAVWPHSEAAGGGLLDTQLQQQPDLQQQQQPQQEQEQPQQEQQQQQQVQQQQEELQGLPQVQEQVQHPPPPPPPQQQQQQTASRKLDRPVPEFYASLLQPESPDAADAAGGDAVFSAATPAGARPTQPQQAPAPPGVSAAAAAAAVPAREPIVSSKSWDPLGASTSAPPSDAPLEGLTHAGSLQPSHSRSLS